jgi:hypothetical protein
MHYQYKGMKMDSNGFDWLKKCNALSANVIYSKICGCTAQCKGTLDYKGKLNMGLYK